MGEKYKGGYGIDGSFWGGRGERKTYHPMVKKTESRMAGKL